MVKRLGYYLFLAFLVVVLFASLGFASTDTSSSTVSENVTSETTLWTVIQGAVGSGFNATSNFFDKVLGFVAGTNDISGQSIHLLSKRYWVSDADKPWYTSLAAGNALFGIWAALLFLVFDFKIVLYALFGVATGQLYNAEYKWGYSCLSFLFFYFVFAGIPVINRILYFATLDFTGLSWFFRGIVVAFVLVMGPRMYTSYRKYRRGEEMYKKQLGREAMEQIQRETLKGR